MALGSKLPAVLPASSKLEAELPDVAVAGGALFPSTGDESFPDDDEVPDAEFNGGPGVGTGDAVVGASESVNTQPRVQSSSKHKPTLAKHYHKMKDDPMPVNARAQYEEERPDPTEHIPKAATHQANGQRDRNKTHSPRCTVKNNISTLRCQYLS